MYRASSTYTIRIEVYLSAYDAKQYKNSTQLSAEQCSFAYGYCSFFTMGHEFGYDILLERRMSTQSLFERAIASSTF